MAFNFKHSYAELPSDFYSNVQAKIPTNPQLITLNKALCRDLNINLSEDEASRYLSGAQFMKGSKPISQVYAGHQFGHFVPQLGDGRALLLGEHQIKDTKRVDIQLKGAGPTPYSRAGDGLSPLGPVLREYIISECLHYLGISSTRSLAAVSTGDLVYREEPLKGAVLTRVADSHIRIGTFEYFYYKQDFKHLKTLLQYSMSRHFAHLSFEPKGYHQFLREVGHAYLRLVSLWMSKGFIHGVMNTDNAAISGQSIDFGPCAFMDTFRFNQVFSYIDRYGRYAYDQQGPIAIWNLSCLALCIAPFIVNNESEINTFIKDECAYFNEYFQNQWCIQMGQKLGIFNAHLNDAPFISSYLKHLQDKKADFTHSFHILPETIHTNEEPFLSIYKRLKKQAQPFNEAILLMKKNNPLFIARNHLINRAISDATLGDYDLFKQLLKAVKTPFLKIDQADQLYDIPNSSEQITHTFCGT